MFCGKFVQAILFWKKSNLQTYYDLEMEKDRLAGRLEREVREYAAG